jgi:hypothetical protein
MVVEETPNGTIDGIFALSAREGCFVLDPNITSITKARVGGVFVTRATALVCKPVIGGGTIMRT